MKVVKAGPAPYGLMTQETEWFLKLSIISATGTASGSVAVTGNDANKECSVHIISSSPSSPHFTVALYGSVTAAR